MSTWSTTDKSANITLSGGNLVATVGAASAQGVRSTTAKSTGKIYLEFTPSVGVGGTGLGFANSAWNETDVNGIGGDNNSVGMASNGQVFLNNVVITTLATFVAGDTVCMAVDWAGQKVAFRTNGGNWNNNVANNPATAAASFAGINAGPYFAAFGDAVNTEVCTINFGGTAFAQAVPSGYAKWDGADFRRTLSALGTRAGARQMVK